MRNTNESGIAMITTLLVLMLMSALLVGFTTIVMSDQRYRFIDRDRGQAFYAASAGVEKLTADLGNLFFEFVAPTAAQVTALTAAAKMPTISGITFAAPAAPLALPASQLTSYHCSGVAPNLNSKLPVLVGTNGYTITFCRANATGNPTISDDALVIGGTGAYSGMTALQTPYQIDVTAKTSTNGEVHLVRTIQSVSIPVFQFMMFSESDLSFFAGANFGFGGRVHTNGNLWLAEGNAVQLTMTGKVTAVKDVVRQFLANGSSIDAGNWTGNVNLATSLLAPVGNRNLLRTEGSVVGLPLSAPYANWQTVSLGATPANYNGFLKNTATGAKKLSLPLTATGVTGCVPMPCTNVEIVRRPLVGEDTAGILYNERLFSKASLRILLSDTAADITNLPGISAGAPVSLETNWNIAANLPAGPPAYGPVGITRPSPALSPGARMATVVGPIVAGQINFATAAIASVFKPKFALCNGGPCAVAPVNAIACDVKTNNSFTNCTAANMPTTLIGATLTSVSPAGGIGGVTSVTNTTVATVAGVTTAVTFLAGATVRFNPLPFWDTSTVPPTLVQCTGTYIATQLTGCSSTPAVGAILVSAAMSDPGISTLGGFIKIDRQNADSSWTDVTLEILNYGIGATNQSGVACFPAAPFDPTPNAIIRLQRLRDNVTACDYNTDITGAKDPTNWWPNVLFDAREALQRDSNYPNPAPGVPANDPNFLTLGGVMHYVNIDAGNLARWFRRNTAPFNVGTGNLAKVDGTGFTVYFSDRRNNRDVNSRETGEYGWEDFVNPLVANGVPNATLQTGEDVNENTTLEVYGGIPNYNGVYSVLGTVPPCAGPPTCAATYVAGTGGYVLTGAARPTTTLSPMVAKVNRPILFRRALMLSNGASIGANAVVADRLTGLTVVSENPVYIKGNWNADIPTGVGTGFGGVNAASAVIADAVTLLSNQWSDAVSFASPYLKAGRVANTPSWYRVAIIAGKGVSFPLPVVGGGIAADFGTDGGAHNFLRFLEDFGGQTVNYMGSLATLYYNRQAVGTYKCCTTVYGAPTRAYNFDVNFLNPALLPPNTPMFRDMNVVGFSEELRPGK
jgi:hypothetical protein